MKNVVGGYQIIDIISLGALVSGTAKNITDKDVIDVLKSYLEDVNGEIRFSQKIIKKPIHLQVLIGDYPSSVNIVSLGDDYTYLLGSMATQDGAIVVRILVSSEGTIDGAEFSVVTAGI